MIYHYNHFDDFFVLTAFGSHTNKPARAHFIRSKFDQKSTISNGVFLDTEMFLNVF